MKRIGVFTIAFAMTIAACGGSNDTVAEPDVEVETVDDGALRLAGGDVQMINGCRIEPNTQCPRANLSEADLSWAFLWDAILSGADLEGADLHGARLFRADLREANLSWANLSDANLRGADLSGARFCGTTMPDGTKRNGNC